MTAEAKVIYEALLEHGPLDTIRLRREAHMSAESAKSHFGRALMELQVGLKVLPHRRGRGRCLEICVHLRDRAAALS